MKKSTVTVITLDMFGAILLGLGLCMALIAEWNVVRPGILLGSLGAAILLVMAIVWKWKENSQPVRLSGTTVGEILGGTLGALLLSISLCLLTVWHRKDIALLIGTVGLLLCVIPIIKEWK